MSKRLISVIITLIFITQNSTIIFAQESTGNPVYIVQPGENLTEIAEKFNISVQEIISINGIIDSNLISAGTELIIPGLEGVSGLLLTSPVQVGETLTVILRKNKITLENFLKRLQAPQRFSLAPILFFQIPMLIVSMLIILLL